MALSIPMICASLACVCTEQMLFKYTLDMSISISAWKYYLSTIIHENTTVTAYQNQNASQTPQLLLIIKETNF